MGKVEQAGNSVSPLKEFMSREEYMSYEGKEARLDLVEGCTLSVEGDLHVPEALIRQACGLNPIDKFCDVPRDEIFSYEFSVKTLWLCDSLKGVARSDLETVNIRTYCEKIEGWRKDIDNPIRVSARNAVFYAGLAYVGGLLLWKLPGIIYGTVSLPISTLSASLRLTMGVTKEVISIPRGIRNVVSSESRATKRTALARKTVEEAAAAEKKATPQKPKSKLRAGIRARIKAVWNLPTRIKKALAARKAAAKVTAAEKAAKVREPKPKLSTRIWARLKAAKNWLTGLPRRTFKNIAGKLGRTGVRIKTAVPQWFATLPRRIYNSFGEMFRKIGGHAANEYIKVATSFRNLVHQAKSEFAALRTWSWNRHTDAGGTDGENNGGAGGNGGNSTNTSPPTKPAQPQTVDSSASQMSEVVQFIPAEHTLAYNFAKGALGEAAALQLLGSSGVIKVPRAQIVGPVLRPAAGPRVGLRLAPAGQVGGVNGLGGMIGLGIIIILRGPTGIEEDMEAMSRSMRLRGCQGNPSSECMMEFGPSIGML